MLVKMFLFSLVLLQILSALNAESLVDLPLKLDGHESLMLEAILTAQANGEQYFLQEFISVNQYGQGKIEISSKSDSIKVHYAVSHNEHFGTNKRLVVQETSCDLFSYSTKWDKMLPNINKPLLNLILLLGPSVFYRINGYATSWKQVASSNVRGKNMIGYQASINQRLKITYYYKSEFDKDERKPSRILFDGYDPGASFSPNEKLIMDIYSIDDSPVVFSAQVQVTPGVGCPLYVSDSQVMPSLRTTQMQMIVHESVVGSSTSLTKDEYYIDTGRSLIRRITTHLDITVDAIYDYNLGLIYVLQDQSCLVQPMGLTSPALDQNGAFSWQSLLWMDVVYFYLGEVDFESYPGFKVSAWEAVANDMTLRSGKYDKVVTTLYMAKSDERDLFYGYTLVGSVRKAYKKGSNGNYLLVETTKRNYYDARSTASEDEFNDRFQVGDCYKNPESRIELAFKLTCSAQGCRQLAEDMLTEFKYTFKSYILSDYKISPLRIDDISFVINDNQLVAYTTFLERPTFSSAFQKRGVYIGSDYLNKLSGVDMADESQCLDYQAAYFAPIRYVLYCTRSQRKLCYHVEKGATLPTGGNENYCKVYDVPLGNFHRFGQELNLKDVHEFMLDKASYSTLYFQGVKYQVEDVVDKTQLFNDEAQFPFQVAIHDARIKEDDNFQVVYAEKVANLGQCYRECLHSDETICETFSYCESSTGVECLITKSPFETISDNITIDKNCNTYSKNFYSDYFKVPEKKFISTASATISIPLYDCASLCHSSKGCYSFQFCDGYCTFGGYFTDSNSEYDEKCDIYVPKVSNNYQITGKKIVEQAYHTELNLNMAQCASICYDISDGDQKCKSFNYCPKGRTQSSCLLTTYSVNDPNTKTIESENCYNYEILDKGQSKRVSVNETPGGTSGGAAFGIIMLFLVGGLAVGLVLPFAYDKVKLLPSVSSIRERFQQGSAELGFGWSKQVNEDEGRARLDQTTIE